METCLPWEGEFIDGLLFLKPHFVCNLYIYEHMTQLGHPVPGGYKYGNLALQVEGVSDETVKYGFGF
jgi:hypothetical protein